MTGEVLLCWFQRTGLALGQCPLATAGGNPPLLVTGLLLTFLLLYVCKTTAKAWCCDPECFAWLSVTAGLTAEGLEHALLLLELAEW